MNGIAFHVEGIYEKGIPTPTAPQYSILPEVIPENWVKLIFYGTSFELYNFPFSFGFNFLACS
jgi:hypothetical protein